jgi:hypothetical protein
MDASQLWCLEIVHSNLKHKFSIFYVPKVSEMLRNTPKHLCVQWSRMDASLLWYPKRVHLGPKHTFSTYYMAKISEVV